MPGHRRGRSLSEGLMLEESEKGGLVISSVIGGSSGNHGLKEGDEIVGATINFDQLSKDDVLKILKLMDDNGFDEKVQVLTKNNLSKSMGTLDSIKAPDEMLKDSYNRLYNAKINRFMTDDSPGQPAGAGERGSHNGQVKGKGPGPLWDKPKVKVRTPDLDLSAAEMCLLDVRLPDLSTPDIDIPSGKFKLQKQHAELKAPDFNVDASSGKLKMPKFGFSGLKRPDLGIYADVKTPKVSLKAPKIKGGLDAPDLNLPKVDLKAPKLDVNTPDIDIDAKIQNARV
nr:neuroblast differentiation-associated protein AHNAK-like isoform X3 [Salvelinus alpinus]